MRRGKFGIDLTKETLFILFFSTVLVAGTAVTYLYSYHLATRHQAAVITKAQATEHDLRQRLQAAAVSIKILQTEDTRTANEHQAAALKSVHDTFSHSSSVYEDLVDLKLAGAKKYDDLDTMFAQTLQFLADGNYGSAQTTLTALEKSIKTEKDKIAASFAIPAAVAVNNSAPGSGFSRQRVQSDAGEFMVDIIAADLNSTRVLVDTASDGDCADNCPVLSLGDYVARTGAFAGINGSYFCPASYPSCAGKKNSFDTLAMNRNKKYINSANNVYSTVPAVIFSGNSARFVGRSLEWGRDTGVDAVLANYPLLVSNGQVATGATGNGKQDSRGPRSFVGATGSTAYIGVVYNASVAEAAQTLKKMGVNNALNLDSGGSTALWSGGYKVGPGRAIPNAIVFVRK